MIIHLHENICNLNPLGVEIKIPSFFLSLKILIGFMLTNIQDSV